MIAYYTSVSVEPMMKAHTKTYSVKGIDELKLYDKVILHQTNVGCTV